MEKEYILNNANDYIRLDKEIHILKGMLTNLISAVRKVKHSDRAAAYFRKKHNYIYNRVAFLEKYLIDKQNIYYNVLDKFSPYEV